MVRGSGVRQGARGGDASRGSGWIGADAATVFLRASAAHCGKSAGEQGSVAVAADYFAFRLQERGSAAVARGVGFVGRVRRLDRDDAEDDEFE